MEWDKAKECGEYRAPSLEREGFIHCSTEKQVVHVANAFYRGQKDLVLLAVDETRLEPEVKWEPPAEPVAPGHSPADQFPHIYGAINVEAVASVLDLEPDPVTETFNFPPP